MMKRRTTIWLAANICLATVAANAQENKFKPGDTFKDCQTCPEMVVIPAGEFMMGSTKQEQIWALAADTHKNRLKAEQPRHHVTIGAKFAVGKFEVTQAEWLVFMAKNLSRFKGARHPIEQVSWDDVQVYLGALSKLTGKSYRLLSEAEWEYVARAGTLKVFHTGDQITSIQANFNGRFRFNGSPKGQYRKRTLPVGSFPANKFGVHDMHGNVWEWVSDCWNVDYKDGPKNGVARSAGDCSKRILRGGSWNSGPEGLRSTTRQRYVKNFRYHEFGFRVARTLK